MNHARIANPDLEIRLPALSQMIGIRNRLIHGYADVDDEIIWDVIVNKIPALSIELQQLIDSTEPASS